MSKFDDIQIGDKAELKHKITQTDIEKFVDLTGDENKLHVDREYASQTTIKKPVVHGMLGASFISTVIGTQLPGDGALWFSQNLEFISPVRVGDTITIEAEVKKKIRKTKILELSTDIYNQNRQKVTAGTAKVKCIEQDMAVRSEKVNKNRVALVVGASGGIGKAVCKQLSKDGYDIVIHFNKNKKQAQKIKEGIIDLGKKAITIGADILDLERVQEMIDEIVMDFGGISVVVNCASIDIANIKVSNQKWSNIQNQIDINVRGTFNIVKSVLPIMELEKFGIIINITTQSIERPNTEWLHYITAKSALHGFSKALAFELAPKGIRVNMVSPGMTDTELLANIPDKVRLLTKAQTPLRRIARPEDIAGAVSYLASEKSNYLVGETIRVNGGQVML